MCGIAGFVGRGDSDVLQRMIKTISYRGPDDSGTWHEGAVGLAHRRLAIIDLSPAGAQPMRRGHLAITFNGEIYNYRELRAKLARSGASFVSESDTEVILALFEQKGESTFALLEGMFAFALYDAREDALYLVRDRFGEKPLYYAQKGDTIVFASEPKALFEHPLMPRKINPEGLASFMLYDAPITPTSMWRDVKKVPAATCLTFKSGTVSSQVFWHPSFEERRTVFADALEEADTLVRSSVERQLVSDVPLGVFLSGGIDSSLIAAYAKEIAGNVYTFSIGFEEKSYDESPYARTVAEHLGTDHYERIIHANEVRDTLTALVPRMDEPIADPAILPAHLLSCFAREHVTVALSGDGGDELFLGYPTFLAEQLLSIYQRTPRFARSIFSSLALRLPSSRRYFSADFLLKQFLRGALKAPLYAHRDWLSAFSVDEARSVLSETYRIALIEPAVRTDEVVAIADGAPPLMRSSWWYVRTVLDLYLTKTDRASMYTSLETRAPLLDRTLAEFALSLPSEYKLRRGRGKYLLRKLAEQKLPHNIAWRRKHGFSMPVGSWLMHEWRPLLTDTLSRTNVVRAGLCQWEEVERLLTEHFSGTHNHQKKLWSLLVLHLWYNAWMQ